MMNDAEQKAEISRWVNEYSDSLFAYLMVRIKDRDIAKDLLQETFLAAWRNIKQFNAEASAKTWLFAIMKNKLIDHYRKESASVIAPLPDKEDPYFDEADHWQSNYYPA